MDYVSISTLGLWCKVGRCWIIAAMISAWESRGSIKKSSFVRSMVCAVQAEHTRNLLKMMAER